MINLVAQNSYFQKKLNKQMGRFQNNPSIGSVHPKSTDAYPLAWGNKKLEQNMEC
jgi:hypothetical protein